jgi:hypothetical protein
MLEFFRSTKFFLKTEKWPWCGVFVDAVLDSVSLTSRVRMFASKDCKNRTGSERSNTIFAFGVWSRPLTHLYSALNTPCLLPWVLCHQLVCLLFFQHEYVISCNFPEFWLWFIAVDVIDVLATVSRLRLKTCFYRNVYVSVLGERVAAVEKTAISKGSKSVDSPVSFPSEIETDPFCETWLL